MGTLGQNLALHENLANHSFIVTNKFVLNKRLLTIICIVSQSVLTGGVTVSKNTCLGRPSQATPNMAHLRGVKKYTGPGCRGSLG